MSHFAGPFRALAEILLPCLSHHQERKVIPAGWHVPAYPLPTSIQPEPLLSPFEKRNAPGQTEVSQVCKVE